MLRIFTAMPERRNTCSLSTALGGSCCKIAFTLIDPDRPILNECYRLWLLKKSIFLKTAEIWGIENVYPNREGRL